MTRALIVNADDCNLTPGVTRAILDCHDHGIVTSTTFFVNLPVDPKTVVMILKRKKLGVGLHLNVTLGKPVSDSREVCSLTDEGGLFLRPACYLGKNPSAKELLREYENQIEQFRKIFGRMPTHLDTHHQMHDRPFFYQVLVRAACRNRLPIRRSHLMSWKKNKTAKTTDHLFGYLDSKEHWTQNKLLRTFRRLPEGVSEIFCHPGENDAALKKISSFAAGRSKEARVFNSAMIKDWIKKRGIVLSHYGLCYNQSNP